jgi:regulator of protease activity HflC (stomatin/prohibitin superfamily)
MDLSRPAEVEAEIAWAEQHTCKELRERHDRAEQARWDSLVARNPVVAAEAEAKATQMVSDAIAKGDVQAINYFVAQKYVEAFRELATAPNAKFVMMPMETSGIIGSIAGIAELARESLDKQQSAIASKPPALR